MIAIIDYGMGNLRSVQKGMERVGFDAVVTRDVGADSVGARRRVAGRGRVSALAWRTSASLDLIEPIREHRAAKKTVSGNMPRLSIVVFRERRVRQTKRARSIPRQSGRLSRRSDGAQGAAHGLESASTRSKDSPFLEGISTGDYVYFVHSFYVVPQDSSIVATTTEYGESFVSSIATGAPVRLPVSSGEEPGDWACAFLRTSAGSSPIE